MITVAISPTVTDKQRRDPRFQAELQAATALFNSPRFAQKDRGLLSLHEAGHVVYARAAGGTNIVFHGPRMYWCSGCPLCPGNSPSISKSSVSWTYPPNCDVTVALKAYIGGIVFRQILSDTPNDEASIWSDTQGALQWYRENVGTDEEAFFLDVKTARGEIINDLKSPTFQQLAWNTAAEFEKEVFLTPKPTAVSLWPDTRTSWSPLA